MTRLPVELLQKIFVQAVQIQLDSNPQEAANLQLVSHATREYLLPTIFYVLIVHWPAYEVPRDPPTRSLQFLLYLLANPNSPPRAHVRHIVILPPAIGQLDTYRQETQSEFVEWAIDSVTLAPDQRMQWVSELCLVPQRVFMPQPGFGFAECMTLAYAGWRNDPTLRALKELRIACPIIRRSLAGNSGTMPEVDLVGRIDVRTMAHYCFNIPSGQLATTESLKLRIHLDVGTTAQIESAVMLVKATLQLPALQVVLVVRDFRGINGEAARAQRALCIAFVQAPDLILSPRLGIQLAHRCSRPETGQEYATALRDGLAGELFGEGVSLTVLAETM